MTPLEDLDAIPLDLFDPTNSSNLTCNNEYCLPDDEYVDRIKDYIAPSPFEWVLIFMHMCVFVVGLVGNALVCVAVYRNRAMRTITNYFIVNLAVADFMVILFCLPPTVVWDVTETWFMGTALCKIVLYIQTVSVAVSVLTLTFISIDRWYAICHPLKFKSTTCRAKTAIVIIWIVSLILDCPELYVLETRPSRQMTMDLVYFTQCEPTWSDEWETGYQIAKIVLLYTLPLLFMTVAYYQIIKVLWRSDNIPGHQETLTVRVPIPAHADSPQAPHSHQHGCFNNNSTAMSTRRTFAGSNSEAQLKSRRKAAKMLVAVVAMFAICYFPVHLLNFVRYCGGRESLQQTSILAVMSSISHWFCYFNSAVNPIIYNFMSGKFRREYKRAFLKCVTCGEAGGGPGGDCRFSANDTIHLDRRLAAYANGPHGRDARREELLVKKRRAASLTARRNNFKHSKRINKLNNSVDSNI
nr:PREDICTED: orexin receptor type 1-like isoform X1 [Bemisia tabaci]